MTEADADKISVTWDDVGSPIKGGGYQYREADLSPDNLRKRYSEENELNRSTGSLNSPSKRRALDSVAEIRNEADQMWESAQIDYLKKIIVGLEIKCKVQAASDRWRDADCYFCLGS